MSATDAKNPTVNGAPDDIVAAAQAFVCRIPPKDGLEYAVDEGRHIAEIVAPLGLPDELQAAVHLYPLHRDGFINNNHLNNSNSIYSRIRTAEPVLTARALAAR